MQFFFFVLLSWLESVSLRAIQHRFEQSDIIEIVRIQAFNISIFHHILLFYKHAIVRKKNSPFFFQCIAERIKESGAFCPQCTQPVYSLQSYSGSWTASVDTCQSVSVIWMSHIWHATMQSIIVCSVYLHSTVWIFNSRYFLDFLTIYSWFISCLRLVEGFLCTFTVIRTIYFVCFA